MVLTLDVNGEARQLLLPSHKTLLEVLREDMQLTGTKHGCELGECGTCTVLVDGRPELSCLVLPVQVAGRAITTIEGMVAGSIPGIAARIRRRRPAASALRIGQEFGHSVPPTSMSAT